MSRTESPPDVRSARSCWKTFTVRNCARARREWPGEPSWRIRVRLRLRRSHRDSNAVALRGKVLELGRAKPGRAACPRVGLRCCDEGPVAQLVRAADS